MAAARDSEEAVKEFKECFAFFDRDRDGYLASREFSEVIRALGYAPTETELAALEKTIDRIYSGKLSFSNYIKVLSTIVQPKMKRPTETADTVMSSFSDFEYLCRFKNDGTIAAKDLELLLTRHGDSIDTASFIQFLQFSGLERLTTSDTVEYKSLIDTVITALKAANS